MRVVCVTGCLGFIGSHFTFSCLEKGWKVWGIDKKTYAANDEYLVAFHKYNSFKFIEDDIATLDHLYEVDYVFNFAAETHVDNSIIDSSRFLHSNIMGVQNLLQLIRTKRSYEMPRFIHISTDEVYGDLTKGSHKVTDPLKPSNPYSASKAAGDMLILGWNRTYKVPFNIIRPTNNYGLGQYPEKLIPKAVKYLTLGKKIPLHGDGTYIRNWLHVDDTVRAIHKIVEKGFVNTIYNVAGNYEAQNKEIIKKVIKSYFGKEKPIEDYVEYNYVRDGGDVRYSLDDSDTKRLGWNNKMKFDDAINEIVNHYKNFFTW